MQNDDEIDNIINDLLNEKNISCKPTIALLNSVLKYFIHNSTFTSIDFHNKKPIPPTPKAAFFRTFSQPRKGGTCFQINGALHYVLSIIGYEVTLHPARVKAEGSTRYHFLQDSHMALTVKFEDEIYLVDPGWGNVPEKILCIQGKEVQIGSERFKVVTHNQITSYQLYIESEQQWVSQFELDLNNNMAYPAFEKLNQFAQSPHYPFHENFCALKWTKDGLYAFDNDTLQLFRHDGKKAIINVAELGGIKPALQNIFALSEQYLEEFDFEKLHPKLADKLNAMWINECETNKIGFK